MAQPCRSVSLDHGKRVRHHRVSLLYRYTESGTAPTPLLSARRAQQDRERQKLISEFTSELHLVPCRGLAPFKMLLG